MERERRGGVQDPTVAWFEFGDDLEKFVWMGVAVWAKGELGANMVRGIMVGMKKKRSLARENSGLYGLRVGGGSEVGRYGPSWPSDETDTRETNM